MTQDINLHVKQSNIMGRITSATIPCEPSGISNWDSAYTNMVANSAIWQAGGTPVDISYLAEASGGWNSTEATVMANSAVWALSGTEVDLGDIPATSGNWNSAYTTVMTNSGMWAMSGTETDITDLAQASGGWNSAEATVRGASGGWGGQILYDKVVTANDYADLRDSLESGTYATVFIPDGTYTVTDNEATPIIVHANIKVVTGESKAGVIIDANNLSSITDALYCHPTVTVKSITVKNLIASAKGFSGQITGGQLAGIAYTHFIDCLATGFGDYAIGFYNAKCTECVVEAINASCIGFRYCDYLTNCMVNSTAYIAFADCNWMHGCKANVAYFAYYSCSYIFNSYARQGALTYYGCNKLYGCLSHSSASGFVSCGTVIGCMSFGDSVGFTTCTGVIEPVCYSTTTPYSGTNTVLDVTDASPVGSMVRSTQAPSSRHHRCDGSVLTQAGHPLLYAQVGLLQDFSDFETISLTGYQYFRMRYGDGRFVAIGLDIGCSLDNGSSWTNESLSGVVGYDVAYSDTLGVWIAVGSSGKILKSTNGIDWTVQTTPTGSADIYCIAWCGTQFVAGGVGNLIITSPNGIDWTSQTSPLSNGFQAIAYSTKGDFIVMGDFVGNIIRSTDGINWITVYPASASTIQVRILDMAYIPDMDIIIAGTQASWLGGACYSTDGKAWRQQMMSNGVADIVRVCSDGHNGYFMSSNGVIFKMGGDYVLRPVLISGVVGTWSYGRMAYGNNTLLFEFSSEQVIRRVLCEYNKSTSFRLPSPPLDAGITYDTWIKGD